MANEQIDKNEFLDKHLRHRLTLLRTLRKRPRSKYDYKDQGDIYRCVKDSNLIAVRLLMDFLGIKGQYKNKNYSLIPTYSCRSLCQSRQRACTSYDKI